MKFMARHAGEIAGASDRLQPSIDEVRGQSPDARGSGFLRVAGGCLITQASTGLAHPKQLMTY